MIIEGVVTTLRADGSPHIAPMGPVLTADGRTLILRPFQSSTTYQNLKRHPEGVFHITDDVELIARAAVGRIEAPVVPASAVHGNRLKDACRALEFRVSSLDDDEARTTIHASVVHEEHVRPFYGFNRAKHAVLEAAILATRVHLLPAGEIRRKLADLAVLVTKTGGEAEARALRFLDEYVSNAALASTEPPSKDSAARDRGLPCDAVVDVKTGSRLHFGLLAPGDSLPRRFGGAGIMVARPGIHLRIRGAPKASACGPLGDRALAFAREFLGVEQPPYAFETLEAPPSHGGLGSGTQLALAVARGLCCLRGENVSTAAAALRLGRGQRSAIGLYGFDRGGFVAEAGRRPGDAVAPILSSLPVPEDWRFVLAYPGHHEGLSGDSERQAFQELLSPPVEAVDHLCRLLWMGLLPTLAEADFAGFSEALYDFGIRAGELFASVQGGPFAGPYVARTVEFLRHQGIRGVGQTSWGPTVFALAPDAEAAEHLATVLQEGLHLNPHDITVTAARNEGAEVLTPPGAPSMATLV